MADVSGNERDAKQADASAPSKRSKRRRVKKAKQDGDAKSMTEHVPWQERKANAPASGMTKSLKAVAAELKSLASPDRSYYRVNVKRLVELACLFERMLVVYTRRVPGWAPGGTYAAMFLRAVIVKLQHIGVATDQIAFNNIDMLSSNFALPAPIAMLADSFGVKIDPHSVQIQPCVTDALIQRMVYIVSLLEDGARLPGAHPVILNALSYTQEAYFSYGVWPYMSDLLNAFAARVGVDRGFVVGSDAEFDEAFSALIVSYRRANALVAFANPAAAAAAVRAFWLPSNAVKAAYANGGLGVPFVAAINSVYENVVDPLFASLANAGAAVVADANGVPAVGQPYPALHVHRVPRLVDRLGVEMSVLGSMFHLKEISVDTVGSFAPLVTVINDNGNYSGTSSVAGIGAEEYVVGLVLDHFTELTGRTGFCFNVFNTDRRRKKYYCTPILESPAELLTKMLSDDFNARTLKK
jgi:hypothetical protein